MLLRAVPRDWFPKPCQSLQQERPGPCFLRLLIRECLENCQGAMLSIPLGNLSVVRPVAMIDAVPPFGSMPVEYRPALTFRLRVYRDSVVRNFIVRKD